MKINLDTNVFGELNFIDWLVLNKEMFEIRISVITTLEAFHWYNTRNITVDDF